MGGLLGAERDGDVDEEIDKVILKLNLLELYLSILIVLMGYKGAGG
jgi:hypothetical protein